MGHIELYGINAPACLYKAAANSTTDELPAPIPTAGNLLYDPCASNRYKWYLNRADVQQVWMYG